MSADRERLAEFGSRLNAARRKHAAELTDYYLREIKRQIDTTGIGRAIFTVDNSTGHWAVSDWRAA